MDGQQTETSGLSGCRALDLTDEKGSLCGKILADLGADVVKVEPPGADPSRNTGSFYHGEPDPERSPLWRACNAGKRSVTLDLTAEWDRQTFLHLVAVSDCVIECFTLTLGLEY